jgi:uncharacterized protein (TIGR02147 family)
MPALYEYTDYRLFLKTFYEERKQQDYFFSYRFMGERIGLDHSYLVKILNGARQLPEHILDKVTSFCGLDSKQSEYFKAMVQFSKANKDADIKHWFERMLILKSVTSQGIDDCHYRYFQSWVHAAVRSALDLNNYRDEYDLLAKSLRPTISTSQAKESIELLLSLGMIQRDLNGTLVSTNRHLNTPTTWRSVAIRNYQKECIKLSLEAIDRFAPKDRDISTITMSLPVDRLLEIKELAEQFRNSVVTRINDMDKPNRVYQLNIQLFPIAQSGDPL